jgi:ABC-2 type transport system permease protein
MNVAEQLLRAFAITKKDLLIYYMRGPVIIQGLLIPAFLFITFYFRRSLPIEFVIPGVLGMALFFSVSAITPVIAPWETRMKTFERLVSAPIYLWAIILGDIIASAAFGLLITSLILLVAVVLLGPGILTLPLIAGMIIAAFCFSSLGTLISAPPADNPSNIMLFATLIKFPIIFISGIFVSIAEMGSYRILSFFSPLTYFTDLARHSIQGAGYLSSAVDLEVLLAFTLLFFISSVKWHSKSLSRRF